MRRGLTMVELLVSMAVFSLLAALLVSALVAVMRMSYRGTLRANLQGQATLAITRLVGDLQRSSPAGVSMSSGAVAICPMDGLTGQGTAVWGSSLAIYSRDGRRLLRERWPPGPPDPSRQLAPSFPIHLTPQELAAFASGTNGTEVVLARDVEEFRLSGAGADLSIRLKLARGPDTFELIRAVRLRQP
ncbi:MAG: prepilin-type N-terminal cleavage/methylation domain-containing protein [Candidatus Eremiobacterota bacterium]